ncbi:MAG: hypothetical protein RL722_919 [Pseudomonadota bacterium]|jgi:hypothetical protein
MTVLPFLMRPAPALRGLAAAIGLLCLPGAGALAQERVVYRCPGNLYTDQISARDAQERGCKTLDGAPVTVIQAPRRPAKVEAPAASGPRPEGSKVDPAEQKQRDSDARRILEGELRKEEERLAALQRDYAGGNPERRGDEANYARYQERVAEMKAAIERKQADIAAIRRELAKLAGHS